MSTPGWERLKANKRRVNAKSATQSIPSDHASQEAVRRFNLPTPRPCSFAPSVTTPLYSTTVSGASRGQEDSGTRGPRGGVASLAEWIVVRSGSLLCREELVERRSKRSAPKVCRLPAKSHAQGYPRARGRMG